MSSIVVAPKGSLSQEGISYEREQHSGQGGICGMTTMMI